MSQLHKRRTDEQKSAIFQSFCQVSLSQSEIQKVLDFGKIRFFALLKISREDPQHFTTTYRQNTPTKLSSQDQDKITTAGLKEKEIADNPDQPISGYNYSAIRDRLKKEDVHVSVPIIINGANQLECHRPRKLRKPNDRDVLTESIGRCTYSTRRSKHLWASLTKEKWCLITSINDLQSKTFLLIFFVAKAFGAHIQGAQTLIQTYETLSSIMWTFGGSFGLFRVVIAFAKNMFWKSMT